MFIKYEMSIIVKHLAKARTLAVAKRSLDMINKSGGYVYNMESMGLQNLPHRMKGDTKGSYFIVQFVSPTTEVFGFKESLKFDPELLKASIFKLTDKKEQECSLQDELVPPVYRPVVQKMLQEADERAPKALRKRFQFNTGLDYYPFS